MNTVVQPRGQQRGSPALPGAAPTLKTRGKTDSVLLKVVKGLLSVLKWVALAVLAALVMALVLLSLIWGPTHWALALALAALWVVLVGLLALGPHRFGMWRAQLAATLGLFALGLLTVIVSQLSAYTPAITDAQGKALPGSIASLETVKLNGVDQWISIRGKSVDNPVLLWLSGGPGGSQLVTARHHLAALEDHFVFVNWEQPGAGKSFHAVDHGSLDVERYGADGLALVQYLKQRFNEEKVYIVGESWGSALGIWLAQRYPDHFYALVGTGQMVDFVETEVHDYNFALNLARERGDTKKVDELTRLGPPPYKGEGVSWKQSAYLLDGFAYMNADPNIADDGFDTFQDLLGTEYGLYDKVSWARGVIDSGNVIFPQLWEADVDFRRDAPSLKVPLYFFIGRHDINAPPSIAEEYYRLLDAPHKEWVWFERSGHNPWVTESELFAQEVIARVLKARGR